MQAYKTIQQVGGLNPDNSIDVFTSAQVEKMVETIPLPNGRLLDTMLQAYEVSHPIMEYLG